jgi:hypothetical protein
MLLFLRRLAERGGQSELHQLLTLEQLNVSHRDAVASDGRASVGRLTKVFRLLANELTGLVQLGAAEALRENAQLLWGNRSLIVQAEQVHAVVLDRWPGLGPQCASLRTSLAAYGDAIEAAAGRLIEQAGTTRALGFLPAETWVSFARRSDTRDTGRDPGLVRIRCPGALVVTAGARRGRRISAPSRRHTVPSASAR